MSESRSISTVGVIGSGSFGTVIANVLAENSKVLLYSRRDEVVNAVNEKRHHKSQEIHPGIYCTKDLQMIVETCKVIFPIIPSKHFRSMMEQISPWLQPDHILIHGTKGLDIGISQEKLEKLRDLELSVDKVKTMSQVIGEESIVLKSGCLSGPNLSKEIALGLPAGTVIASRFDEVIRTGKLLLKSKRFVPFENHDLVGVELAGVLKNILAIGSGMISGLELGENARALMITRGWRELMRIGDIFGSDRGAFMGLAGIGDMIATCSSPTSRNYTVGFRLAKGETLEEILSTMEEVAEGVNTIRIAMGLIRHYNVHAPLICSFNSILFEGVSIPEAIAVLVSGEHRPDVDF